MFLPSIYWTFSYQVSRPHNSSEKRSETEAEPGRRINVVTLEIAVRQSAIHLREHETNVNIPPSCEPPVDSSRHGVERSGALRVSAARAADVWPGREKVVLGIMIIGADHVQFVGDGVFRPCPRDLQDFIMTNSGRHTPGCVRYIVDSRNTIRTLCTGREAGPVAGLVGIEGGVVSGVINLESPSV